MRPAAVATTSAGNATSGDGCSATCGLEGGASVDRRLCYLTRLQMMRFGVTPTRGQPPHVPVTSINTSDEFWRERRQSIRETELCVPGETTGLP